MGFGCPQNSFLEPPLLAPSDVLSLAVIISEITSTFEALIAKMGIVIVTL